MELIEADLIDECLRLWARVQELELALQTRVVVEQAKGVLAERLRVRPRDAFELLRLAARSERTKVQALAQRVVDERATPPSILRAGGAEMAPSRRRDEVGR